MRRSSDIAERLARIEETMATREDVAGLRAEIARLQRPPARSFAGTVLWTVTVLGFLVLAAVFADRFGIAP